MCYVENIQSPVIEATIVPAISPNMIPGKLLTSTSTKLEIDSVAFSGFTIAGHIAITNNIIIAPAVKSENILYGFMS